MFLTDDSGAVTVDWVVLTAGLVGLGLATMTVVSTGVQDTAGDTRAQLDGQIIYSAFGTSSDSFSNGIGGWSGGEAVNVAGFGDILRLGDSSGLEAYSQTFDIPEGTEEAVFSFDVLAMDTLDAASGDGISIYADGQLIATGTSIGGGGTDGTRNGELAWTYESVPGITVSANASNIGGDIGGSNAANDGIYGLTVTVDDPSETVSIGFGSSVNQGVNDESIGIDNFTVQTAGL